MKKPLAILLLLFSFVFAQEQGNTFAVRMYLLTNDIYRVKQLMGHSSVTTTEKYAKFNRRRLASDFPSLMPFIEEVVKRVKMPNVETLFVETQSFSPMV